MNAIFSRVKNVDINNTASDDIWVPISTNSLSTEEDDKTIYKIVRWSTLYTWLTKREIVLPDILTNLNIGQELTALYSEHPFYSAFKRRLFVQDWMQNEPTLASWRKASWDSNGHLIPCVCLKTRLSHLVEYLEDRYIYQNKPSIYLGPIQDESEESFCKTVVNVARNQRKGWEVTPLFHRLQDSANNAEEDFRIVIVCPPKDPIECSLELNDLKKLATEAILSPYEGQKIDANQFVMLWKEKFGEVFRAKIDRPRDSISYERI